MAVLGKKYIADWEFLGKIDPFWAILADRKKSSINGILKNFLEVVIMKYKN